jgi:hypothetical protein
MSEAFYIHPKICTSLERNPSPILFPLTHPLPLPPLLNDVDDLLFPRSSTFAGLTSAGNGSASRSIVPLLVVLGMIRY